MNSRSLLTGLALTVVAAANAQTFTETTDAGNSLATAVTPTSANGNLNTINGFNPIGGDVDIYRIFISDPSAFSASVIQTVRTPSLFLFDGNGRGVTYNGNTLSNNSAPITGQFLTTPGIYFLAETTVSATAQSAGGNIFELAPSDVEHAPNGPGATGALTGFTFASGSNFGGNYVITLTGAQAVPAAVPEPATLAVLGLGLAAIVRRRRKSA